MKSAGHRRIRRRGFGVPPPTLWSGAVNLLPGMLEGAQDIMTSLPEMAEQMFASSSNFVSSGRIRGIHRICSRPFFGAADQIWETLSGGDPHQIRSSGLKEFRTRTYLYRYALAIVIYLLWWIKNGNQAQRRLDRTRNDLIDLSFAVYGTYYEGLMTADKKAEWMHQNLFLALDAIGQK
jgi:hypothetical protein